MTESKEKKLVTKEHILFKNDGEKPLPIEMTTIVPVDEEGLEPVYMKLKLVPFLREELTEFNRKPLLLNKGYKAKIDAIDDKEEKAKLEQELQEKSNALNKAQERHIILDRVVEPKFTESDFNFMSRTAIDAIYITMMCASRVSRDLLLRVAGKASSNEAAQ